MAYYKLRFSCEQIFPDGNWPADKAKFYQIFKLIIAKKVADGTPYTCGFEELDKFGDVRPKGCHFHFHFQCYDVRETFRKWLRNNFEKMYNTPLRGPAHYYVRVDPEPEDYQAWLRYPCKELPVKRFCQNPDLEDISGARCQWIKSMHEIGSAESLRRHRHNKEWRKKKNAKKTLFDKLCDFLDENRVPNMTPKGYFLLTQAFYLKEKKPLNRDTMEGYTTNYLMSHGLLSRDFLWKQTSLCKHTTA